MCSNLGHKNKAVIEAIVKQAEKLPTSCRASPTRHGRRGGPANGHAEGTLRYFFSTSGTEANEAAIKMVRQACAPAYKVISRYKSYHGSTAGISPGDPRRWYAEQARFTVPGVCCAGQLLLPLPLRAHLPRCGAVRQDSGLHDPRGRQRGRRHCGAYRRTNGG
jgi:taurine--2-oxoglutarate transaminase